MTNRDRVRKVYPKAHHRRFQKQGGGGYTLVFADRSTLATRLGEGDTTPLAWSDAWKGIKERGEDSPQEKASSQP